MSRYLVERVIAHPAISVHTGSNVVRLAGTDRLEELWISTGADEPVHAYCNGLFCFIGAVPATEWLIGVATDDDGFVLTDRDIPDSAYKRPGRCSTVNRCRSRPVSPGCSQSATPGPGR